MLLSNLALNNNYAFSNFLEEKINRLDASEKAVSNEDNEKGVKYKIDKNGNCLKLEKKVIELMNKERKNWNKEHKKKIKQLKSLKKLRKSARIRSKEMYDNDCFRHERPNGDDWDTVFDEEGIEIKNKHKWAENIQYGITPYMPTPETIFENFKNSKGHYKNMVGDFDYAGVGFYCEYIDDYYVWFVTQHFLTYMPKSKSQD